MFLRIFPAVLGILLISNCSNQSIITLNGETMGTTYSISIVKNSQTAMNKVKIQHEIDSLLFVFNSIFSTYSSSSEISKINADTSRFPLSVSGEFYQLLEESQQMYYETGGKFDITIKPLISLWSFDSEFSSEKIPMENAVNEALTQIGMDQILLDKHTVLKNNPNVQFDMNAIAKGRGVDKIAHFLKSAGFQHFIVEIGGEVYASGVNKNNSFWKIGIKHPEEFSKDITAIAAFSNSGMATSGTYQHFFNWEGKDYSHILDPRTGWPVEHDLISATVIAETCAKADAIATALIVMGFENALHWIEQTEGVECYLIRRDKESRVLTAVHSKNFPLH